MQLAIIKYASLLATLLLMYICVIVLTLIVIMTFFRMAFRPTPAARKHGDSPTSATKSYLKKDTQNLNSDGEIDVDDDSLSDNGLIVLLYL